MLRHVRLVLLALLLLVGRSEWVAHDAQHWQPQTKGHLCALCIQHAGQDQLVEAAAPFTLDHGAYPLNPMPAPAGIDRHARRAYDGRGPPERSA